jgi:hypothetical protein
MNESLNSELSHEDIPHDSMLHQMGSMSAAMIGGSNFHMKKLQNAGYMIQFEKDGATELHHVDDNLQGGYLKGNQPSLRMVGTYRNHIKNLLDQGHRVRIVAHHKLADSFHKIASRLVSKQPDYKISEPTDTEHEITGDKLKSWELSK